MRRIAATALLLFCSSLKAQEPVPLAHGNVPGEPHHHLKIENEYVRVYYVEAPPHESTLLHQHDRDYIYVSLGPSDVVNAIVNKPEFHLQLRDGETHFTRGGFAPVARNLADTPFRNITIELLRPQAEARNVGDPVILNAGFAQCDPAVGPWSGWTEFETDEARLDHVWLSLKRKYKEKVRDLGLLVVGLGSSDVKVMVKGKSTKILHEGEIEWFDRGSNVHFSNGGSKQAEFLKLTFKRARLLKK